MVEESEITVEDVGRVQRWHVKEKICDGKETGLFIGRVCNSVSGF